MYELAKYGMGSNFCSIMMIEGTSRPGGEDRNLVAGHR
jgi:hypothetical protein